MGIVNMRIPFFTSHECEFEQYNQCIFVRVVETLMYSFLLFIPCLISIATILDKLGTYVNNYPLQYKLIFILLALELLGVTMFSCAWTADKERCHRNTSNYLVVSICIAAFFARILAAFILNGVPENDFLSVYQAAIDPESKASMISGVYYYGVYAAVLRVAMNLLGNTTAFVGMLINALCTSLIPAFLYYAVRKFSDSEFPAITAASFYAFFPSMILFSVCLAGENISQLFIAVAFWALAHAWAAEQEQNVPAFWKYLLLSCVSFGFVNLFKPIQQIIIIVIVVEEIVYRIIPALVQGVRTKSVQKILAPCLTTIAFLSCLLISNISVYSAGELFVKSIFGIEFQEGYYGVSTFPEIAFFGLKQEGGGIWNAEVKELQENILGNSANLQEAHKEMLTQLAEEIENDPKAFFNLLYRKIQISWSDEWAYGYYASVPEQGYTSPNDTTSGYFALTVLPRAYIGLLYTLTAIGFLIRIFSRPNEWRREEGLVLMFFGLFTLIFLIMEAHTRYKSTFMPLLCILAALGLFDLKNVTDSISSRYHLWITKKDATK